MKIEKNVSKYNYRIKEQYYKTKDDQTYNVELLEDVK